MSVDEKREKVLEAIYEEMLHKSNFQYPKELAETVKAIEAARLAEKEFELNDNAALVDNANKEIDRKLKRHEIVVNAVIAGVSTVLTLAVFAFELHATRKFEETGTETSAANRWLKNNFPKVKAF